MGGPVFEWLKHFQSLNGPLFRPLSEYWTKSLVFKWTETNLNNLNTGPSVVWYSNGSLNQRAVIQMVTNVATIQIKISYSDPIRIADHTAI